MVIIGKRVQVKQTSAQSGDIREKLERAGLWEKSKEIAPLTNKAKVPNEDIEIKIKVDKKLNVRISVTKPRHSSAKVLEGMLNKQYAAKMKTALVNGGIQVADTIEFVWMLFPKAKN